MPAITQQVPGTFCWPELCTSDAAGAKMFYAALFGWSVEDFHMPEGDYSSYKLEGQNVAGMYEMKKERAAAGIKPHWNVYVAVADAAETAKKGASLGGKVLMQPVQMGNDWMANLEDTTGAKFSIWQTNDKSEAVRLYEKNSLCWAELYSRDTEKSKEFYTKLFGWMTQAFDGGPMPYTVFSPPGMERGVGGMLPMPPGMDHVPDNWLPYFLVDDADKTASQTNELGGKSYMGPMDIATIGRVAVLGDAQGAPFAIIKPEKMM